MGTQSKRHYVALNSLLMHLFQQTDSEHSDFQVSTKH
jgi:hypothetical protein